MLTNGEKKMITIKIPKGDSVNIEFESERNLDNFIGKLVKNQKIIFGKRWRK